jgi:hypothetical protein
MMRASAWKRLAAALAMSLTLHALLFFLPYLGKGASASRVAVQGRQKATTPRSLDATLTPETKPAFAQAEPTPVPAAPPARSRRRIAAWDWACSR